MVAPVFGVMELQNRSEGWSDFGRLTVTWLQDAGGFAAIGLLVWFLYVMVSPAPAIAGSRRRMISKFMAIAGLLAFMMYLVAFGLTVAVRLDNDRQAEEQGVAQQPGQGNAPTLVRQPNALDEYQGYALTAGGLLALLAFGEPFVLDLARLRWRRIAAIARLSLKEAVRRRVIWVFFIVLVVFMFPATWFFFKKMKPEDILKTTISVIGFAMTLLLITTALLLAGFSIPTDVKNQTIHTIVTKPVERFEIVVGRFLGYTILETIALFVLTGISLIFILTSNVDEAARKETMKARVPVYGKLDYVRERAEEDRVRSQSFEGVDVGREYAYRKYIAGGRQSSHRAIWTFTRPGELDDLTTMPAVPLEFAFDIYKTTKGQENKGIETSFDIITWKWDPSREAEYQKAFRDAFRGYRNVSPSEDPDSGGGEDWKKVNEIAEKFGRFQFKNFPVFDYHTYRLMVPPGLFKNALDGKPPVDPAAGSPALVQIKVKCESDSQMLGVAPLDLYLLESEGLFWVNFFKGAVGLWCRLTIVIGLSVAASTYLAGVISMILALCLFIGGYFQEFLTGVALGQNIGGGPFESFTRLVKGSTTAAELDKTPTIQFALFGDDAYRWFFRRLMNVIPDTERFTWSNYLTQGFNISFDFMALNMIFLAAYMLPWFVLAYYLMRSREIAA